MSEFVLMFWRDKPVDWLLEHIMYTKICNPEKDMHLCQIEKRKIKRSIKPAQFQHIGLYSSLKGKTQKLQDASFGRKAGIPSFRNPPLIKAFTDIKAYNRFTLSHLYTGRSAFWGQTFAEGKIHSRRDSMFFAFRMSPTGSGCRLCDIVSAEKYKKNGNS